MCDLCVTFCDIFLNYFAYKSVFFQLAYVPYFFATLFLNYFAYKSVFLQLAYAPYFFATLFL